MLSDLEVLYAPILTSDGSEADKYTSAPRASIERVNALKESYMELRNDMLEEVQVMNTRIVTPAKDARAAIQPYKKVIKKREDRKLDYERYKGRTENYEKKTKRSEREDKALSKYQVDLSSATAEYQAADEHVRNTLPGITNATYSILPHLLNSQIMIQNTLLAHLYTSLHNFSQEHNFPSPPPETPDIIAQFEADFTPLRLELESGIKSIAGGKAVREPMALGRESKSITGLNIRNGFKSRTASSNTVPSASKRPSGSAAPPSPDAPPADIASRPKIQSSNSWNRPPPSPGMLSPDPAAENDYFATGIAPRPRQPSSHSISSTTSIGSAQALAAGKKKPPPPPPPTKRMASDQGMWVTAMYDFQGEAGELSFREGDRIRVVKKTGSEQDWWDGELRGVRGSFPANYCR